MYQQLFSPLLVPPRSLPKGGVLTRTLLPLLLLAVCVQCTPVQQSGQPQNPPQAGRSAIQTMPSPDATQKNAEIAAPAVLSSPEEMLERFNASVDRG